MYQNKKIVVLIPARAGSKGVPNKNIKSLVGLPLIAYSISAAQKSSYVDEIIVSTDSFDIAEVAKKFGAKVPFMRPDHLAQDTSLGIDVVKHALSFFQDNNLSCDVLVLLQPTSPFRSPEDIDNCIRSLVDNSERSCVVSVSKTEHHPLWANTLPESLSLSNFLRDEVKNKNRQSLPDYYRLNGALYCVYPEYLFSQNSFWGIGTYAFVMPPERSTDIDSIIDFDFAEFIYSKNGRRGYLESFYSYGSYLTKKSFLGGIYRKYFLYPLVFGFLKGKGLDIGCGVGDFLSFKKEEIKGIDINPYNISFCSEKGLDVCLFDGATIPHCDNAFDYIVLDNVIEHIAQPDRLIQEIYRTLKPSGWVVIGIPGNKGFLADSDHKINYTLGELRQLFKDFSCIKRRAMPLPIPMLGECLSAYCSYFYFKKNE